VSVFGWWRDWRDRRAALREIGHLQWRDEAALLDQAQNPINLAKLSVAAGELAEAASEWDRARLLLPNAVMTSKDALDILLGLKRYDEAEALMRERGKRSFVNFDHLTGLAKIAEHRGDDAEALKRWQHVRSKVRDSVDGYLGCARCLVKSGRLDEAEAELNRALRREPDNGYVHDRHATIADLRKDWPVSLVRWQRMALTYRYAPAFGRAANAMIELGRFDEAEAWLAEPSRRFPADMDIALARARVAERLGDLNAAADRWATVRATAPRFQTGYHEGALRLFEAERHEEADDVLRSAIERFPNEVWPRHIFARVAHLRRDWNEAATRWDALRRRFPDEEAGYSQGEEALKAAGRDDEAAALHCRS
jgi:tetratricopeptide (TPR) repeat protein